MRHHLVKNLEIEHCYCGKGLREMLWQSQFDGGHHYKVAHCGCGAENRVRVPFHGSGHDRWVAGVNGSASFESMVADEHNKLKK